MKDYPLLASAPLADISGPEFRMSLEEHRGCDLYFTEMISASSALSGSRFEDYYTDFSPAPEKTVAQLVGARTDLLKQAAKKILKSEPRLYGIDINMGCSAPLIFKKGAGIAWMKRTDEIPGLISELREVAGKRSISIKIRLGFIRDEPHFVETVKAAEKGGVDMITVHCRSKADKFKRNADWKYLDIAADNTSAYIMGNGDIGEGSAGKFLREHRNKGMMVGRKSVSEPWVFSRIKAVEQGDPNREPFSRLEYLKRYVNRMLTHTPYELRLKRFRRFALYFSKSLFWDHAFNVKVMNSPDFETAAESAIDYFTIHDDEILDMGR